MTIIHTHFSWLNKVYDNVYIILYGCILYCRVVMTISSWNNNLTCYHIKTEFTNIIQPILTASNICYVFTLFDLKIEYNYRDVHNNIKRAQYFSALHPNHYKNEIVNMTNTIG